MTESRNVRATYHELLTELADAEFGRALTEEIPTSPYEHRRVMALVRAAAVCSLNPRSRWRDNGRTGAFAATGTALLATLPGPDGLFSSSGNISSPPDSAFTAADVAETVGLLRRSDRWPRTRAALEGIVDRVTPGMITGGVHTPNHRWELAAALARIDRVRPDPRIGDRIAAWLSEGVDIDDDGLYSERSANYAAHVSNPALLVLGEHTDDPHLIELVHRNLHAHCDLTDPDGVVETVFSRRQDQHLRDYRTDHNGFGLGAFLPQFHRFAVAGCARCSATVGWIVGAAAPADRDGNDRGPGSSRARGAAAGIEPITALAEILAHPESALRLPPDGEQPPPPRSRFFATAGVAVLRRGRTMTVLNDGADVAGTGRIASGLACNPTLLRWRNGSALLSSMRVTRGFFGLGPFRAERLRQLDEHVFELTETLDACYYQPLDASARRTDGSYRLEHEGRFAAQMSFTDRDRDAIELTTRIRVEVGADSLTVDADFTGPPTGCTLELGFAPGGVLQGAEPLGQDRHRLHGRTGGYQHGQDRIMITIDQDHDRAPVSDYDPGEAYNFLGGTDAVGGPRLSIGCRVPGSLTLRLATG